MEENILTDKEKDNLQWLINDLMDSGLTDEQIEYFIDINYIPNRSQKIFHAAANEVENNLCKYVLLEGNRGGGKSYCEIIQAALDCKKHKGLWVLYLRKVKQSTKEMLQQLSSTALRNIPHKCEQKEIKFPNGSLIRMGGFNSSHDVLQYLGINYDEIIIDELTTIRDEDYETIKGSLRTGREDHFNPRIYASTNPGLVGHKWVKKTFIMPYREHKETDTRCIHSDVDDNLYIGNYKSDILEKYTGELRERWYLGNWDINEGTAFDFSYKKHVVEGTPWEVKLPDRNIVIDENWIRLRGVDFGTSKPYCCLWGALNYQIGRLYIYREDYGANMNTLKQAERIALKTSPEEHIDISFCDPAMARRNDRDVSASAMDDYASKGIYLTAGNRNRQAGKWKIDNLLSSRMDGLPGLMIHSSCKHLIEQLDSLLFDQNQWEDVDTTMEDHAYDALRYMISTYREPNAATAEEPQIKRESHFQTMSRLFR